MNSSCLKSGTHSKCECFMLANFSQWIVCAMWMPLLDRACVSAIPQRTFAQFVNLYVFGHRRKADENGGNRIGSVHIEMYAQIVNWNQPKCHSLNWKYSIKAIGIRLNTFSKLILPSLVLDRILNTTASVRSLKPIPNITKLQTLLLMYVYKCRRKFASLTAHLPSAHICYYLELVCSGADANGMRRAIGLSAISSF